MALFCRIISLENAAEFPIFCRTLSEALFVESKESKDSTIHLRVTFLEFKSPAILNLTRAL